MARAGTPPRAFSALAIRFETLDEASRAAVEAAAGEAVAARQEIVATQKANHAANRKIKRKLKACVAPHARMPPSTPRPPAPTHAHTHTPQLGPCRAPSAVVAQLDHAFQPPALPAIRNLDKVAPDAIKQSWAAAASASAGKSSAKQLAMVFCTTMITALTNITALTGIAECGFKAAVGENFVCTGLIAAGVTAVVFETYCRLMGCMSHGVLRTLAVAGRGSANRNDADVGGACPAPRASPPPAVGAHPAHEARGCPLHAH